jgi:hypothetical protein
MSSESERAMHATIWNEGYIACLAGHGPDANPFVATRPEDQVLSIGGHGDLFDKSVPFDVSAPPQGTLYVGEWHDGAPDLDTITRELGDPDKVREARERGRRYDQERDHG